MALEIKKIIQGSFEVLLLFLLLSPVVGVCSSDAGRSSPPLTLQAAVDLAVAIIPAWPRFKPAQRQ
ncbi:MAG: hypothetical protein JKY62_04585 [Desulfocapsa sp.]|nr:hypothetical protein [Desulfocapsa sp.]